MLDILATVAACAAGCLCGQVIAWLWRSDLRLQLVRKVTPTAPAVPLPPEQPAHAAAVSVEDEIAIVHRWARLNPWYVADPVMNLEAQHIHMSLRRREPHLTLEANLAEVTAEMHRRHPGLVTTRH